MDLDFSVGGSGGASTVTGEAGGFGGLGSGGATGSAQTGSGGRGASGSSGEGGSGVGGGPNPLDASGTGGRPDASTVDVAEAGPPDAAPEAARDASAEANCAGGGTALSFDGVSTRVTIAGAALPVANKARTIEMWLKVKAAAPDWSPNHTVFEYGGDGTGAGFGVDMDTFPSMELYVHPSATSLFFNTGVAQEKWFHFAASYDGTTLRAFIDGVERGTKTMSAALATTTTPLSIAGANSARKYFSGSIDEVRVWSVARTGDEIKQAMSQRLAGSEPGLVGYWHFDEGTGAIARDATPGRHDAMLVGTTLPAWGASGIPLGCP
jgi:hypothetical protein